jgi:sigma-B regulation protein RsbU (phosphoserine phosphatase)
MNTFAPAAELQALEKLRDEELEEARALQSVMLPTESLRSRGVTISHQFQPVSAVGGDFLDYFELTDGSIGLYLGDVSGKGLPAAFFGALAVGTLRGVHKTGISADQVLATMNRRLMIRGLPARHAALQYAVFNPATREIQISSAGMPGPLHLSGKGCRLLKLSGIPPGLWPCTSYEATVLRLEPGDSVLFCTDGVTDSMNRDEESFGTDRLVAICDQHLSDSPTHLLQAIFLAVESFSQGRGPHDDMAAALFYCSE